jgi:regulator of nonsense transcripts 2
MEQIEKEIQELEKQVDIIAVTNIDEEQTHAEEYEKELDSANGVSTEEDLASMNSLALGPTVATSSGSSLASSNMKALMDSFITQMPNCVNRELIDKAAKEFCMNLNSKANRKRLVGALFQVQRTRLDLLPFYSRFVAILNPCMPEISNDLSLLLLNDFRFHVRKKDQINIESKIKTVRFIGELVKFNMFFKLDALNCLKTLLADFKHHNVEMACNLLDVCGRFLYRNQESHMKLKLLLVNFKIIV